MTNDIAEFVSSHGQSADYEFNVGSGCAFCGEFDVELITVEAHRDPTLVCKDADACRERMNS